MTNKENQCCNDCCPKDMEDINGDRVLISDPSCINDTCPCHTVEKEDGGWIKRFKGLCFQFGLGDIGEAAMIDYISKVRADAIQEERERILAAIPQEDINFLYLSKENREFAKQLRQFITNPTNTKES